MIPEHVSIFVCLLCSAFLQTETVRVSNYIKDIQAAEGNTDTYLTPPKIIRKHGYPAESHIIESQDGYLLEYHRIPHGKDRNVSMNKPYPILLHHGLLCSSVDWIINGPKRSLGYLLADQGYDVWLANARGNTYSRSHVSMSPKEKEFWDFTFHEMGMYDVPAAIDHILNTTGAEKLVYIGHSLGTTTFYTFAATRPEYSSKILFQISLAPVGGLGHTSSAFRLLVPYAKTIESMSDWYNKGAFLEHDFLTSLFCKFICGKDIFNYNICEQLVIFKLFGKDVAQFNQDLVPIILSNQPAGTSGKNMIHCAQMISSGTLSYYDYGLAENILRYHHSKPPLYNLSSITIPMRFYYGKNDILADPTDVELLYKKIPKPMGLVLIDYDKWNHVDFLWASDVNKYFNEQVLKFIEESTSQPKSVATAVKNAIIERKQLEVRDVPFNEEKFRQKFGNYSELDSMVNNLFDGQNQMKLHFDNGVNVVKNGVKDIQDTISQSVNRTARTFRDGIEKTANNVKTAVEGEFNRAKDTVDSSVKAIEEKMRKSMDDLKSILKI